MRESRPTIIEAYVDPFEPPMPPKVEVGVFVNNLAESFARGQPYGSRGRFNSALEIKCITF